MFFVVAVVTLLCSDVKSGCNVDLVFTELTLLSIWVPARIEVWMRVHMEVWGVKNI